MRKLTHLIGVLLMLALPLCLQAQQMNWKIPVKSTSGAGSNHVILNPESPLIEVDFSSPTPTYNTYDVVGQHSSQAIGNGSYCTDCAGNNYIGEFTITGSINEPFYADYGTVLNPIERTYPLMVTYDQGSVSGCLQTFDVLNNPNAGNIPHNSVAEIAIGSGNQPGRFWMAYQDADPVNFTVGNGISIDHVDFNRSNIYLTQININGTSVPVLSGLTFHEGIALGPEFVNTSSNPSLNGANCRSVYFASRQFFDPNNAANNIPGALHQYVINLDNVLASTYVGSINLAPNVIGANILAELELSFPPSAGLHPRFLGMAGSTGVAVIRLGANGEFLTGPNDLQDLTNSSIYGVEFDPFNNYMYYGVNTGTNNSEIRRVDLQSFNALVTTEQTLVNFAVDFSVLPSPGNILIENAGNGSMYVLGSTGILYEIVNPSAVTIPTVVLEKNLVSFLASQTNPITAEVGFGLPDWVDGEVQLATQGAVALEICIERDPCDPSINLTPVPTSVNLNGVTVATVNVIPDGGCQTVYVCPGGNYSVDYDGMYTDPLGVINTDRQSSYQIVFNDPITATISGPSNICYNDVVTLSASSYCPGGFGCEYEWSITGGDGAIVSPTNTGSTVDIQATGFQRIGVQLIVTDPVTGCQKSFFHNMFVDPDIYISSVVEDATCINGSEGSIHLNVPGGFMVNTWGFSDPNYTPTIDAPTEYFMENLPAGNYTVTAQYLSCTKEIPFIVNDEICCPDYIRDNYQLIDNVTYSTDVFWDNKVLVNGTVTVTGSAVLDISTVDVVFTETGEIVFQDDSRLRANNSVFRPCEEAKTWLGITFEDNSTGQVNECLFKAAEHAVAIQDNADVKVSNTEFSNCALSIWLQDVSDHTSSFTGNTFLTDQDLAASFAANDVYHVLLVNSDMLGMISQNDFAFKGDATSQNVYGVIVSLGGTAMVVSNKFTNLHNSITAVSARALLVEGNDIELTRKITGNVLQYNIAQDPQVNAFQVTISNPTGQVEVLNNTLSTSNITTQSSSPTGGIWFSAGDNVVVKGNTIEGFEYAIASVSNAFDQIIDNTITNAGLVGIFISNGVTHNVRCNTVDLEFYQATNTINNLVGIIYLIDDPTVLAPVTGTQIRNNCVMETNQAIVLVNADATVREIPTVSNNFLYNYLLDGVFVSGFTNQGGGTGPGIGAGTGIYAEEGRNSFISNNTPNGALDINSTGPLNEGGNWGVTAVNANVTQLGSGDQYFSSASCALQFPTGGAALTNESTEDESCYLTETLIADLANRGAAALRVIGAGQVMDPYYPAVRTAITNLYNNGNRQAGVNLLDEVIQLQAFSPMVINWLLFDVKVLDEDYSAARQQLQSITTTSPAEADRWFVENTSLMLELQLTTIETLGESDLDELKAIDKRRGEYAPIAREILSKHYGANYDYLHYLPDHFKTVPEEGVKTDVTKDRINVFPNPTTDLVSIEYFLEDVSGANLVITDVTGKLLYERPIDYNITTMVVDMGKYANGLYFISIISNNGVRVSSKVVKR